MFPLGCAAALLRRPTATWTAIAAEGDTRGRLLAVDVPVLVLLPWALLALIGLLLGAGPTTEQFTVQAQRPDGSTVAIGTGTRQSLGLVGTAVLMAPLALGLGYLAVLLLRDLVLQAAPRFGAAADPVAATKLAAHGLTGFSLSALLLPIPVLGGVIAVLAGTAHALWLLHRGASLVMAPEPAQAGALARAVLWRAVLVGLIAAVVGTVVAVAFMALAGPVLQRVVFG